MYIASGWGQMSPCGPFFVRIINSQSYCPFPARLTSCFIEIGPLVPEKKIFEGFLPYMGMAAILVM